MSEINKIGHVSEIKTESVQNSTKVEGPKLGGFAYGFGSNIDSTQIEHNDQFAGMFPQYDNIDGWAYVQVAQKGVDNLDGEKINTNDQTYISDMEYWAKSELALCEI